jgi:fatty acid desaturase
MTVDRDMLDTMKARDKAERKRQSVRAVLITGSIFFVFIAAYVTISILNNTIWA